MTRCLLLLVSALLSSGFDHAIADSMDGEKGITNASASIADNFNLDAPVHTNDAAKHWIWVTAYVVRIAQAVSSANAVPLLDSHGHATGISLSHLDWCNAAMEGTVTVQITKGVARTFNYDHGATADSTNCSDVFPHVPGSKVSAVNKSLFSEVPADAPFGLGASPKYRLVPYRSIAVDRSPGSMFPLGTLLFIPKLKGVALTLPNGKKISHDGYVMAVDTGGLIQGSHIDFFKGIDANGQPPPAVASTATHPIDAYVVDDEHVRAVLTADHLRDVL